MTIRNLDALFQPGSIALVGASRRAGSLGAVLARNLFAGGFQGPIMPVHPNSDAIEGVLAYPSVEALPQTPDLAVIATPPDSVAGLLKAFGDRGTRAAVVITAGFGEGGDGAGAARKQAILDAAQPNLLRIVGPNCLGMMVPGLGINASFSHIAPLPGDLAFVTQSGAMVTAMLDWATPRGIGFSKIVSLGDKADVDFGDLLDYLAMDGRTRAILLYVESIAHARKFLSAARIAARNKPVIVVKGGRHAEGAAAAASHTGALAGADAVYDAVFARAGLLRVYSLNELFDAAETLTNLSVQRRRADGGGRLAILTNGGGLGVLATDALIDEGGRLAALSPETKQALDACLPATWSGANPVDIIGDAPGARYRAALEALLKEPSADAVLVMHCPTAIASATEAAEAVVETLAARAGRVRPVFTAWVGDQAVGEARALFAREGIAGYDTPEEAVQGFMHLERYRRNQALLLRVPRPEPEGEEPDRPAVRGLLDQALAEQREWLSEAEAKAVLQAYGIPVVATRVVADPEAAGAAAAEIGGPVALKILSRDITHKSDMGGVALDLQGAAAVTEAAEAMNRRIAAAAPTALLEGFTVQAMCRRPDAEELILGVVDDPQFGPVMLFGQGGTAVEVIADKALALPPLDTVLAEAMMAETRVYRLLQGYRDRPPAAVDEIAACLVRLSQLIIDMPEIGEVDINPLLADAEGVIALDARVRVTPRGLSTTGAPAAATARLAIRPYPRELERSFALPDGTAVFLRPLRPSDAPALRETFRRLDAEDVRMRFLMPLDEISDDLLARLTQLDYDREMALAAFAPSGGGQGDNGQADKGQEGLGVVRLAADPDNRKAEFAIVVRSDMKRRGLGRALMKAILDYAEARGTGQVWGSVLAGNTAMLALCKEFGFSLVHAEAGVVHVTRDLAAVPE
ncbi:bifunctional acetate--CoA ligase family protein/GNAT family N-acetyltransferase [Pelagibius litoralis]|uniref:Bifunctional acetate--CoA ligase family protein/GNAT family N-acetyltransferase n=1 Tax=Pelagibius litoralis TaxID=374515 RepID=A0A967F2N2_9PROT|nr:bifunctional acetate--CoA ligase family protein/GNAT family N-acetyltransferase [Pelagibius litoralis]NIA71975.1 bifunctional acetate--CoA ligase family protein/GNAT family N-acetyltransferase [Pelagibius litoralis]